MFKLEQRPQPSKLWTYAAPLLALAVTVGIGVLLFILLGKDPVKGLQAFFGSRSNPPTHWASWP